MKIHCDVCDKGEASVFCVADEAALCAACDHRVHHANKLAGKHQRFSLHHPSPKQAPVCDVCQESRAFLFCQQDRAILCKDCDLRIHKSNEHTQRHTRFLLTGVKLSSTATLYSQSLDVVPIPSIKEKPVLGSQTKSKRTDSRSSTAPVTGSCLMNNAASSSSISEYLMEMVPAWHVEDFFDYSFPSPSCVWKNGGNIDGMPFLDADIETSFPNEKMGLWVPQDTPPPLNQAQQYHSYQSVESGTKEQSRELVSNNISVKATRKWSEETCFVVPQIEPALSASTKRLRASSW